MGSDIELSGATLENNGGGSITADLNSTITFTGVAVTSDSSILANNSGHITFNGGSVTAGGGIDAVNNGVITFDKVVFSNTGDIEALSQGSITFSSDGTTGVDNDGGFIDAAGGGAITFDSSLRGVINSGDGSGFSGLILAEADSTITFGAITVTNDTGTITAFGADATIFLEGTTVDGGTLRSGDSGVIQSCHRHRDAVGRGHLRRHNAADCLRHRLRS